MYMYIQYVCCPYWKMNIQYKRVAEETGGKGREGSGRRREKLGSVEAFTSLVLPQVGWHDGTVHTGGSGGGRVQYTSCYISPSQWPRPGGRLRHTRMWLCMYMKQAVIGTSQLHSLHAHMRLCVTVYETKTLLFQAYFIFSPYQQEIHITCHQIRLSVWPNPPQQLITTSCDLSWCVYIKLHVYSDPVFHSADWLLWWSSQTGRGNRKRVHGTYMYIHTYLASPTAEIHVHDRYKHTWNIQAQWG